MLVRTGTGSETLSSACEGDSPAGKLRRILSFFTEILFCVILIRKSTALEVSLCLDRCDNCSQTSDSKA